MSLISGTWMSRTHEPVLWTRPSTPGWGSMILPTAQGAGGSYGSHRPAIWTSLVGNIRRMSTRSCRLTPDCVPTYMTCGSEDSYCPMSRTPGEMVGNLPRQLVLQVRCHVLEGFCQLPVSFNTVGAVLAQDFVPHVAINHHTDRKASISRPNGPKQPIPVE